MSYGYGGRQNENPFADEPSRGPPAGSRYDAPSYGRDEYSASNNVEMEPLTQGSNSYPSSDPNALLNECSSIDKGIEEVEQNLVQLRMLQDRSLNEADSAGSATSRQLDALASETMALYRQLTERVRQVKSQRAAQQPRNAAQVGRVDRRLKQAIQQYQQVESSFRKKTQDQMARQYRIVNPDATESEIRAVVNDTSAGGQVFQQAMMQSDRRGQARAVLSAVQDRHDALQKIEQQMIELAQLFQDMDTLIIQQDAQIAQIEQKTEVVVEDLDKGNVEIENAVGYAKASRKKKWICLGICVAIIIVIIIIVVVYIVVTHHGSSSSTSKRGLEIRGVDFAGERPVARLYAESKIVVRSPEQPFSSRILNTVQRKALLAPSEKRSSLLGETLSSISKRYVINTDFTENESSTST